MSTAAGSKNYGFLVVSNTTGNIVPNISGGWLGYSYVNGISGTFTPVVTQPIPGLPGFYNFQYNFGSGTGWYSVQNAVADNYVEPQISDIQDNTYDTDSIYGRFLQATTVNAGGTSASTVSYSTTCNDDFLRTLTVNTASIDTGYGLTSASISGCSFTVGSTTPTISGGIFGGTVTVTSAINNTILVNIPKASLPSSLLPSYSQIPFDVQMITPTGKKLTVLKLNLTMLTDNDPV